MTSKNLIQEHSWKCPATPENVDLVSLAASQKLEKYTLQKADLFAIELLLRESLNNALIHGCHHNPLLSFSCSLMISDREVIIKVSDDGEGFNWHDLLKELPGISNENGRGIYIYKIYAQVIKFNDKGNCVKLIRTLGETPRVNG